MQDVWKTLRTKTDWRIYSRSFRQHRSDSCFWEKIDIGFLIQTDEELFRIRIEEAKSFIYKNFDEKIVRSTRKGAKKEFNFNVGGFIIMRELSPLRAAEEETKRMFILSSNIF